MARAVWPARLRTVQTPRAGSSHWSSEIRPSSSTNELPDRANSAALLTVTIVASRAARLGQMTATRPAPERISGRFVALEPLTAAHLPALYRAIGTPRVFAGGYGGGPAGLPQSEGEFIAFAMDYFAFDTGNPYAVFLAGGPHDGELVGTSTLSDFLPQSGSTHI